MIETSGLDGPSESPSRHENQQFRPQTSPQTHSHSRQSSSVLNVQTQISSPTATTPVKTLRSPGPMSPIRSPFGKGIKTEKGGLDFLSKDQLEVDIPLVVSTDSVTYSSRGVGQRDKKDNREMNAISIRKSKEGKLSKFLANSPQASRMSPRASIDQNHDQAFPLSAHTHHHQQQQQQQQHLNRSQYDFEEEENNHHTHQRETVQRNDNVGVKLEDLNRRRNVPGTSNGRVVYDGIETSWKNLNSNTVREWNYWKEDQSPKLAAQQIQRIYRGHQGRKEASRMILRNEREKLRSRQRKQRQNMSKELSAAVGKRDEVVEGSVTTRNNYHDLDEVSPSMHPSTTRATESIEVYTLQLLKAGKHTDEEIRSLVTSRVAENLKERLIEETSPPPRAKQQRNKRITQSKHSEPAAPVQSKVDIFQISRKAPHIEVTSHTDSNSPRRENLGLMQYENELVINYDERGIPRTPQSPQGRAIVRHYKQTPSKLTSDPSAPTHPITIGQDNSRKQIRRDRDITNAIEPTESYMYPNAPIALPPSQAEKSQRPRIRRVQQRSPMPEEQPKETKQAPPAPHLLSNHRERQALASARKAQLERVDESSRELDGTETILTARSNRSDMKSQQSIAPNLARREAEKRLVSNSETLRRQNEEENKLLEELDSLNNRKKSLLVNIKSKDDNGMLSQHPLKQDISDGKNMFVAPQRRDEGVKDRRKQGQVGDGEERKLSRREEVALARAEREKLGLAFGPGAANQKKRKDQINRDKNVNKAAGGRGIRKKKMQAWGDDNSDMNIEFNNDGEIMSVASSRAPSVASRAPSMGIASVISDARSQVSNASKPSLIGQAPPKLVGEKARLLALARREDSQSNQPSAGYLNRFRSKKESVGVRKVYRNVDGAMNDDCISELTSLGGATSLPPLVPPRNHDHDNDQPATYGNEAPKSLRAKERTFSAPARSQQFDDGFVTVPDDDDY